MRATTGDYTHVLQQLLPPGAAWPRDAEATLTKLLGAIAAGLARVHNRGVDLIDEADPRTTLQLLSDWERVAGLPDECAGAADTIQERRNQLVAKLIATGGQSRAFFIAVAAALGFEVTITEFRPFRTGVSRTGEPLCGADWWFAWQVNAPEETIRYFRTGQSAAGEPLADWGNDILECVIGRLKPAHTTVIFTYGA